MAWNYILLHVDMKQYQKIQSWRHVLSDKISTWIECSRTKEKEKSFNISLALSHIIVDNFKPPSHTGVRGFSEICLSSCRTETQKDIRSQANSEFRRLSLDRRDIVWDGIRRQIINKLPKVKFRCVEKAETSLSLLDAKIRRLGLRLRRLGFFIGTKQIVVEGSCLSVDIE